MTASYPKPRDYAQVPSHRRSGRRRARSHRLLPVLLSVGLLGMGGLVGPAVVHSVVNGVGNAQHQRISLTALPADAPDQGLVYAGLHPGKVGSLCAGAYALDETTCTHGPAPAPVGLAVRNDVAAVTAKSTALLAPVRDTVAAPPEAEIVRDIGGTALTANAPALIPAAAPGEADFVMGAQQVACEADGHSGKRVQALYVHEFGTPSRYSDFLGSARTWAAGADQIFDASAAETGGSRHLRFVTTPQCQVDVAEVQVPAKSLDSFTGTIAALGKLGYNRTDRKYLLFADTNVYCGIASYIPDHRPGLGNRNNGGPSYGRVDAGCWSSVMVARELTETLGALLTDSPNSSGAGSCLDGYDLLCSKDRSGKAVRTVCPRSHANRLDCGHDDYFSTDPKPGSYLAKNWNIATSEFLLRSDGGDDIPDTGVAVPTAPATPNPTTTTAAPTPTAQPAETDPANQAAGDQNDGGGNAADSGDSPPSAAANQPRGDYPTGQPGQPGPPSQQPTPGATETAAPATPTATPTTPASTASPVQPDPVQAVLEIRDATSSSVRLTWSAAAPKATYAVSVDGKPIATTVATRAQLVGLKPDGAYKVTIKSGPAYTAKGTAQTAPAARPTQQSSFVLINALTGTAANLYAARTAVGTPLTLGDNADGDAQQQWQLVAAGNGSYSLVSQATGECAVPLGGNPVDGAPMVQGSCTGNNGARWSLQATDYGFTVRTTSGLVIGVGNQRFGAQRVLTLQQPNGQRYQSWTAVPD